MEGAEKRQKDGKLPGDTRTERQKQREKERVQGAQGQPELSYTSGPGRRDKAAFLGGVVSAQVPTWGVEGARIPLLPPRSRGSHSSPSPSHSLVPDLGGAAGSQMPRIVGYQASASEGISPYLTDGETKAQICPDGPGLTSFSHSSE